MAFPKDELPSHVVEPSAYSLIDRTAESKSDPLVPRHSETVATSVDPSQPSVNPVPLQPALESSHGDTEDLVKDLSSESSSKDIVLSHHSRGSIIPARGHSKISGGIVESKGKDDLSTGTFGKVFGGIKVITVKLWDAVKKITGTLVGYEQQLAMHMNKLMKIQDSVEQRNATMAIDMCKLESDVNAIRRKYDTIVSFTRAVVYYGTGNTIPHIINLLAQKKYENAAKEIKSFLDLFMDLISKVEDAIKEMEEDVPVNLKDAKDEIEKHIRNSNSSINDFAKKHEDTIMESHDELTWRMIGTNTLLLFAEGVVSNVFYCPIGPIQAASQDLFHDRFLKVSESYRNANDRTASVRNQVRSITDNVYSDLTAFFKELHGIENDVEDIKANIQRFLNEACSQLTTKATSFDESGTSVTFAEMDYLSSVLQKLHGDCQEMKEDLGKRGSKRKHSQTDN